MTRESHQVQEGRGNGGIKSSLLHGIDFPAPTSFGHRKCRGQVIEKIPAGDGFGAQGQNVWGGLLAVHEAKSPRLELADQRDQGDLRGVRHTGEHRFCEKGSAERHAIESANQLSFLPGFNRMGIAEFV